MKNVPQEHIQGGPLVVFAVGAVYFIECVFQISQTATIAKILPEALVGIILKC